MTSSAPARRAAYGVSAFLGLALTAGTAHAVEKIRFVTQEWEPYQYTQNGQITGIAVDAVRCLAAAIGVQAEIEVKPWVRAQKMVENGDADAFFAASASPERDVFAIMSAPVAPQVWRWYLPADSAKDPSKPGDLKVGVLPGSAMEKFLVEKQYNIVQKPAEAGQLVKLLESRRIDAVLANELVFQDALRDTKTPESAFKTVEHSNRPLGVYFAKRFLDANPGLLAKVNAAVPGCKK